MPLKRILFFIACIFVHSSCQNRGPNIPGPGTPTDTEVQDLNDVSGIIDAADWSLKVSDVQKITLNGVKYFEIRLSNSTTIKSCSKDLKPVFSDKRIYITVPAKEGSYAAAESVSFRYYKDDYTPVWDTAQKGYVKITKITDLKLVGTLNSEGFAENVSGDFSSKFCSN